MPPTVQTTLSPLVQQGSPAMAGSPGLGCGAPIHHAAHDMAPLGTTYYSTQGVYEEEVPDTRNVALPYTSYVGPYPVNQPPPNMYPPMQPVVYSGSAGSSPAPQHTPPMKPQHTPPMQPQQSTPPALPVSSAYSTLPVQETHYQHQPLVYAASVLPGTMPPNQLLHIQIPVPGFTAPSQAFSQTTYQPPSDGCLSVPIPASQHTSVTTNLEVVWHAEFDRLFKTFHPEHRWFLVPRLEPPEDFQGRTFKDSAKVRFCCKCGNGWTSMKGRVMFWFHLDQAARMGFVYFRLYGQRCSKCENPDFVHAMWYPEEVLKVVNNIFMRVGQVYYHFYQPPLQLNRRQGKPRNQHNAKLCQACAEGVCKEGFVS